MEAVMEYADRKTELEEKVRSFEAEKGSLLADISALKEKITTLELERVASTLKGEVETLRNEKAALEEKVSEYTPGSYDAQPQAVEGYKV